MEQLLAYARGPLFLATFFFMVMALFRLVALHLLAIRGVWSRTRDHNFKIGDAAKMIGEWIIPAKHVLQTRPLFSITSFVWHISLILVPLLFVSHILLWERGLATFIPGSAAINIPDFIQLNMHFADLLTLITVVLTLVMFLFRAVNPVSRALSEPMDYALLGLLIIPFLTGFLAAHPAMLGSVPYTAVMLLHILSAEAIFVLMPFTKLAHVALFPFGRISSYIYWRFPEGAGQTIAGELHGEEAKV